MRNRVSSYEFCKVVHVRNPKTGNLETITAGLTLDEKNPLVKAHRWAFVTSDELVADEPVTFGPAEVEAATAAPGEKRSVKPKGGTRKKAPVKK